MRKSRRNSQKLFSRKINKKLTLDDFRESSNMALYLQINLQIFQCGFIDIWVVMIFQKECDFPVTTRDLIFYQKHYSMISWYAAYKCCNTNDKNPNFVFFQLAKKSENSQNMEKQNKSHRFAQDSSPTARTLRTILLR